MLQRRSESSCGPVAFEQEAVVKRVSLVSLASLVLSICAASAPAARAQTLKTLVNFSGSNGANPYATVIQGKDGNFYGTTFAGGANSEGTVFEITAEGKFRTLYNFCSLANCADGSLPQASLVQGVNGNLYGTVSYGGAHNAGGIFEITATGGVKLIYSFCSRAGCADGSTPSAALLLGRNGNFYGTTWTGGVGGGGTVFEVTATGALKTLHSFCSQPNCADGEKPTAALIQARNGNFWGTTSSGGSAGDGTVFKMSPTGALTTLHSFNGSDGSNAVAGLVQATDGNFYGITELGGDNNAGTVFQITPAAALTTIYKFCSQSGCDDGANPEGQLIQASDGNLYGTTFQGGVTAQGTIFKITTAGALTTVYTFCSLSGCADGQFPVASLIQASNGDFYGTTVLSGVFGQGIVYGLLNGSDAVMEVGSAERP